MSGLVGPSSSDSNSDSVSETSSHEGSTDSDSDRSETMEMGHIKTGSMATMIRSDSLGNNPASTLYDISYKTSSRRDNLSVPSFGNQLSIDFLGKYQRDRV